MSNRKIFTDSISQLPLQPGSTLNGLKVNARRAADSQEKLVVSFSLAIPSQAHDDLEALVARGETITPDELNSRYSVDEKEISPLLAWLPTAGYQDIRVSKDRTSVFAKPTVQAIEQSLQVKMVRVTKDGVTYAAAQNAPSLPAEIAASVHAIGGLQPFRHAHRHDRRVAPKNRISKFAGLKEVSAPATNIANNPPYLVQEVLKAYNADGLNVTGKGQIIAILIDTFPDIADIQAFWGRNNLSTSPDRIQMINVTGATLPPREGEETLDAEWSSGIAPGATLRIYASGSLQFPNLDRALDQIITDFPTHKGMNQMSISLGLGETFMQQGEMRTQHQKYLRLAALGVNIFVSSGDAGSNPDGSGHGSDGPLQAEYSASDPCVIGVGGTSLALAADGTAGSETAWADGGGGKSGFWPRPSWQKGAGVPSGSNRLVPDVSLTADPNDGAFVILNGEVQQIGGTSWSAPVWAGFCALINEARNSAGKPPLSFLNPTIYPLLGTPAFRDITTGSNGAFTAGPGYDLITGLGVPDIKALIAKLTA